MAKSKWEDSFIQKGYELAGEGLIDLQIAKKLGISETTYYDYMNDHPKFSEAIKIGKLESDVEVIQSARKRALGYDVEETHTEMKVDQEGQQGSVTMLRKHKRHIPASDTAIKFWLMNRQPELYKDIRHLEGNLGGGVTLIVDKETKEDLDGIKEFGTRRPNGSDDSIQEESESS